MIDVARLKPCDGCRYLARSTSGIPMACEYILLTGKRRPCPPGKGCTVKDTAPREFQEKKRGRPITLSKEEKRLRTLANTKAWKKRNAERVKAYQHEYYIRNKAEKAAKEAADGTGQEKPICDHLAAAEAT